MFRPWKKHQRAGHDVVRVRELGMHYIKCTTCGRWWNLR